MTRDDAARAQPRSGWIASPGFDLAFFYGGSVLAAAAGVVTLVRPELLIPLLWLWMLLIEGPHLFATFSRTYLDAGERRARGRLLWGSLLWFAPPLALWAAAELTGVRAISDGLLLFAALWAYHHGIRQHYGILAIYEAHARTPRFLWWLDKWALMGVLWVLYGLSLFILPVNERMWPELAAPGLAWPRALAEGVLWVALSALVLALVGGALWRAHKKLSLRPALFALGPVVALGGFQIFIIGVREPVYAAAVNPEQLLLSVTLVAGIVHGVQYLGIVIATNRRRYRRSDRADDRSLAARLGRAPALAYALAVVASVSYVLLDAGRAVHPGVDLVTADSSAAGFFMALYIGLFFHHYYLDQRIWHVRSDRRLRFELGLS
ncbi:hypothetical protein [Haliangium sp.]|uniref:hypothetical protein n=1 Tax=Haliangium sp. TaxID=2663208 RepID=UPI003D1498A1